MTYWLYGWVRLPKKNWKMAIAAIDSPNETTIRPNGPVLLRRSGSHSPTLRTSPRTPHNNTDNTAATIRDRPRLWLNHQAKSAPTVTISP